MIYKSKPKEAVEVDAIFYNGQNGEEVANKFPSLAWIGGTFNQLTCHRNESSFTVEKKCMVFERDGNLCFTTLEQFESEYEPI